MVNLGGGLVECDSVGISCVYFSLEEDEDVVDYYGE